MLKHNLLNSEQTVIDIINELKNKDITLWTDGVQLHCKAPKGTFTEKTKKLLEQRKKEIISYLTKVTASQVHCKSNLLKADEREYYKASPVQKRMYILNQLEPTSLNYNISLALILKGDLEKETNTSIFRQLMQRHDLLRTSFEMIDGEIIQRINDGIQFDINYLQAKERELPGIIKEFIRPFDLGKAPLFRVGQVSIGTTKHLLLVDMHHIISDAVSINILIREFNELYCDRELPELKVQYRDFSEWQNRFLQTDNAKKQKNYWLKQFKDEISLLSLPTDYQRPAVQSFEGDCIRFVIEPELAKCLKAIGRKTGSTLFMVLLAVYNILLSKYTGQEDIIVGTPISGRIHADMENVVGMFVNTLALRNKPEGGKRFKEFLVNLRENTFEAYENQEYQFDQLVEDLDIKWDLSRNPLFNVMFVLQNASNNDWGVESQKLKVTPFEFTNRTSKFDLTLLAIESYNGIQFVLEYCSRLYAKETIQRMAGHFLRIVKQIIENPDMKLSEIEFITEEERRWILSFYNDTKTEYPYQTIPELFADQAAKTPDNIALVYEDKEMTYKELNQKANQLAGLLREKGVGPNCIVGIMAERSLEMVVGILGILKAGGAYLPIDPEYPEERIRFMLEDSNTGILLTQNHLKEKLILEQEIIDLNNEAIYHGVSVNLKGIHQPKDLAYVIYTSGTSGKPKGVMIEQRSIASRIQWRRDEYQLGDDDRVLQLFSFTFDGFLTSCFTPIVSGSRLILVNKDEAIDPIEIKRHIVKHQITHFISVPMLYAAILEFSSPEEIQSLRMITLAGDSIKPSLIKASVAKNARLELANEYGPTETSVVSTFQRNLQQTIRITIGKPVSNTRVYITDRRQHLLPLGIPGELCISGIGLARGYLANPELTSERFIPNPFNPGERMYRTGDRARWLPDGNIEFLGRIDQQVKLRGFRIEPGEIENQLLKHASIKEAVVIAGEDRNGTKYLCAYLIAGRELTVKELREYLGQELPEYMVPSYFVQLDKLPLTPNGKIDRKALPQPEGNIPTGVEYEAPANAIEERLVAIWQEILGQDKIGNNDNFFELGGHSLKATTFIAKIYKEFHVAMPLREIFQTPTVKGLAKYIQGAESNLYAAIDPAEKGEYYPVSSAQKRLFIIDKMEGVGTGYNMPQVMKIEGELDPERFKAAFQGLVMRHETLRTSFEMCEGEPVQRIYDEIKLNIHYHEAEESEIDQIVPRLIRPFDLSQAPLFRVEIIKINETRHILLCDMHHIVSDGVSMGILIREFIDLYQGEVLPGLRIQSKDYAVWQNELFKTDKIAKQEEYWMKTLSGEISALNLPTDYIRPGIRSFQGDRIQFKLEAEDAAKLNRLAQESSASLYMLLLAIYNVLLSKYTRQEEIIIGSPIAGRPHPDLENVIGMFVNTLAMKNGPQEEKTFREFLKDVRENTLAAYENQDYPFEELVEKLNPSRDLSRNPLFDAMFVLQSFDHGNTAIEGLTITPYPFENRIAKFDLTLQAAEAETGIYFQLEYCTKLFKAETIEQMAVHFRNLIQRIVQDPEAKLAELEMLTAAEKHRILYEFNATKADYPKDRTIQELFEEQVAKTSDNIALVYEDQTMTYGELNRRANQVARILRKKGVGPDSIVGIMVGRSFEMMVGIIGVLKAGGAYFPVSPEYPEGRIRFMLEDSQVKLLVTEERLKKQYEFDQDIMDLDDKAIYTGADTDLEVINQPNDLAYVIYTSGSTGQPKGVMVEHRNVVNLISDRITEYNFTAQERVVLFAKFIFDASVEQIFITLCSGSCLFMPDEQLIMTTDQFENYLVKNRITHLNTTPSFLALIDPNKRYSLKRVVVGGEECPATLIEDWRKRNPLYNVYGPTESTVDATAIRYYKNVLVDKVSIGKPIANTQCYIVGNNQKPVPVGIPGELCIAGAGLARGYLNRSKLTAEKFIANPYHLEGRMYRTGDLARWLPDGNIEFLGRLDQQVKIRGFRIEPGEIENQLLKHEAIKEAVVIAKEDGNEAKYLCAYLVAGRELTVKELREYLGQELPEYMVPSYFVQLDKLPLTPNGKIDRKALPQPEGNIQTGVEYVAPSNVIEEKLAEIWRGVLGLEKIGVNDNFFELGGHSLKAVQIIYKVSQELRVEVSLVDFSKKPTVKEISNIIQSNGAIHVYEDKNLMCLKNAPNSNNHVFLVHDVSGEVNGYLQMVDRLSNEFNYWGIKAGILDKIYPQNVKIELLAKYYIESIKKVQASGPYHIAGWSNGGTIAFEVVRQLEIAKDQVSFFIMIDSLPPNQNLKKQVNEFNFKTEINIIKSMLSGENIENIIKKPVSIEGLYKGFLKYINEKKIDITIDDRSYHKIISKVCSDKKIAYELKLFYLNRIRTISRACSDYIPNSSINTKLYYIKASESNNIQEQKWNKFCNVPVHTLMVQGDHFSIFEPPKVDNLTKMFIDLMS
jgi:amino acid adenylation domain-containing protein